MSERKILSHDDIMIRHIRWHDSGVKPYSDWSDEDIIEEYRSRTPQDKASQTIDLLFGIDPKQPDADLCRLNMVTWDYSDMAHAAGNWLHAHIFGAPGYDCDLPAHVVRWATGHYTWAVKSQWYAEARIGIRSVGDITRQVALDYMQASEQHTPLALLTDTDVVKVGREMYRLGRNYYGGGYVVDEVYDCDEADILPQPSAERIQGYCDVLNATDAIDKANAEVIVDVPWSYLPYPTPMHDAVSAAMMRDPYYRAWVLTQFVETCLGESGGYNGPWQPTAQQ